MICSSYDMQLICSWLFSQWCNLPKWFHSTEGGHWRGDNALLCTTDRLYCCMGPGFHAGNFYFPDGTRVSIASQVYADGSGYYRNRGIQLVRLNRLSQSGVITGRFRCEIPSNIDDNSVLYISIGIDVHDIMHTST